MAVPRLHSLVRPFTERAVCTTYTQTMLGSLLLGNAPTHRACARQQTRNVRGVASTRQVQYKDHDLRLSNQRGAETSPLPRAPKSACAHPGSHRLTVAVNHPARAPATPRQDATARSVDCDVTARLHALDAFQRDDSVGKANALTAQPGN